MKKRLACIMLNLIIPGLGQLVMGAWVRGAVMIIGAIACMIWFLYEALAPLLMMYRDEFSEEIKFHFGFMLTSLALILLIYLWSIADVVFCCETTSTNKDEEKDSCGEF